MSFFKTINISSRIFGTDEMVAGPVI